MFSDEEIAASYLLESRQHRELTFRDIVDDDGQNGRYATKRLAGYGVRSDYISTLEHTKRWRVKNREHIKAYNKRYKAQQREYSNTPGAIAVRLSRWKVRHPTIVLIPIEVACVASQVSEAA